MDKDKTNLSLALVKSKPFDTILKHFKEEILKGGLKSGDRLLPERELGNRIGVSRASLREALRALEMVGIIVSVPGQGSYMLPPNVRSLSSFFELMLMLKPTISENILELRLTLECEAVRLATKRATPQELAYIKEIINRMPKTLTRGQLGVETDVEFHLAIMRATHNDLFVFVYEIIDAFLRHSHYERRVGVLSVPQIGKQFIDVHKNVYNALMKGDEELAVKMMEKHFLFINKLLNK
jgi:GntR family transcriptional regulator, transcriptional repressor for pyruvate dehydrogenase complex